VYVGWCEKVHEEGLPPTVQWELRTKVFKRRWQDDIIQVVDDSASKEAKEAMRERSSKRFYRGELELEEEKGEDTAFGYRWSVDGGILGCEAVNKFELEIPGEWKEKEWPEVAGPAQFTPEGRKYGTALGRVLRALDMTNAEEPEVARQVARILLQLRGAGYPTEMMMRILKRAERESWAKLRGLRWIPRLSPGVAKVMGGLEDISVRVERVVAKHEACERERTRARPRRQ